MALGKNLKKKKLISDDLEKSPKKKAVKTVPTKKKKLIEKEKPVKKSKVVTNKRKAAPKKVQEKKPASKSPERTQDSVLSMYIAKELTERKKLLRKRYSEQIEGLKDKTIQFIACQIADELYAIDIDQVKEIVQMPKLSKTPNTPAHIKGIAFVRGVNYVVFDLAARFQVSEKSEYTFLLIINDKEIKASLSLTSLPSTFKAEGKNISSEMNMIEDASLDISYIKGIIQYQGNLIYYLDIIEMLKSDKAVVVPDSMISGE